MNPLHGRPVTREIQVSLRILASVCPCSTSFLNKWKRGRAVELRYLCDHSKLRMLTLLIWREKYSEDTLFIHCMWSYSILVDIGLGCINMPILYLYYFIWMW